MQVSRWRDLFLGFGLQGIERDLPRGAPPVKVGVANLVELTMQALFRWALIVTANRAA